MPHHQPSVLGLARVPRRPGVQLPAQALDLVGHVRHPLHGVEQTRPVAENLRALVFELRHGLVALLGNIGRLLRGAVLRMFYSL